MNASLTFKDIVANLNKSLPSEQMVDLPPLGRAYKKDNDYGVYAGLVHAKVIGEPGHESMLRALAKKPRLGQAYLGAAGWINLSYIAATQAPYGLMIDVNPLQTLLWQKTFGMVAVSPTPQDILPRMSRLKERMSVDIRNAFGDCVLSENDIQRSRIPLKTLHMMRDSWPTDIGVWMECSDAPETQWLHKNYGHLHNMAKNDRLAALTIDLTDAAAWDELAENLKPQNIKFGTIYSSNIFDFLGSGNGWTGQTAFRSSDYYAVQNLKKVLTDDPLILDFSDRAYLKNAVADTIVTPLAKRPTIWKQILGRK